MILDVSGFDQSFLNMIIKKDSDFLCQQGVMDYSLLINVEMADLKKSIKAGGRLYKNNFFISQDGLEYYHVGIIDFLQKYDFGKKTEHFFLTYFSNKNPQLISCVDPKTYANRFNNFCSKNVVGEIYSRFEM